MESKLTKEKQFMEKLYEKLTQGDIESSLKVHDEYMRIFDGYDFIGKILKPVIERIEEEYTNQKIAISTEHVAKNVATTLTKIIADMQNDNNV